MQGHQIRPPLLPMPPSPHLCVVAAGLIDRPEYVGEGLLAQQPAITIHLADGGVQFAAQRGVRAAFGIGQHRLMEFAVAIVRAQTGQLVLTEARPQQSAAQHSRKRNVLLKIVEHGQQCEHISHFARVEQSRTCIRPDRDAHLPQHVGQRAGTVPG
jgi:hypothetical protein